MRNRLIALCASLLFLGSLSAVYAGGGKEKAAPEAKKAPVQKVTLLHFMGEQTKRNGLKQICDAVTAKNPNVVYEIEGVAYAQYTGILKTRLAADDAPDLFTGWPNQYVEIIRAGQVMDLSSKAPGRKIIPWLAKECTVDGKLSGIPLDVQMYGAFYNKDVFDKYGLKVPTTFDELIKVCDTLMANKVYPFVRSYKNANFPWVEYTCFAYPLLCQDPSTSNILWRSIFEKKAKFADYPAFVESELLAEMQPYAVVHVLDADAVEARVFLPRFFEEPRDLRLVDSDSVVFHPEDEGIGHPFGTDEDASASPGKLDAVEEGVLRERLEHEAQRLKPRGRLVFQEFEGEPVFVPEFLEDEVVGNVLELLLHGGEFRSAHGEAEQLYQG